MRPGNERMDWAHLASVAVIIIVFPGLILLTSVLGWIGIVHAIVAKVWP